MFDLVIKVLINAVGVYAAIQLVPQIHFPAAENLSTFGDNWWKLLGVALIIALINSYLKPILKALSFPITLLTMAVSEASRPRPPTKAWSILSTETGNRFR